MAAKFSSAVAALIAAAFLLSGTAPGNAAEDYTTTTCPPGKPYCVKVTKPALTPAEVDLIEGRTAVSTSPTEEARKAEARAASYYRDPISINLCPRPWYVMTDWNGCRSARLP